MPSLNTKKKSSSAITPLLLKGAVERTGSDHIPGGYCNDRQVWIIAGLPIIEARSGLAELTTKTEANIERDDTVPSVLEMQTKTLAQAERDDQDLGISLLELSTKTDAVAERDD